MNEEQRCEEKGGQQQQHRAADHQLPPGGEGALQPKRMSGGHFVFGDLVIRRRNRVEQFSKHI